MDFLQTIFNMVINYLFISLNHESKEKTGRNNLSLLDDNNYTSFNASNWERSYVSRYTSK